MFWFIIAVGLCAVELGVKAWVNRSVGENEEKPIMNGKVVLTRKYNEGLMMGALKNKPRKIIGLTLLSLGFLLGIFYLATGKKGNFLLKLGTTVALGGAMSNAYERLKDGKVTDYFRLNILKKLKVSKVVFNIADYMIFFGCLVMLIARGRA
ncbi:MAG: signal peptidase II [Lachnospiraceae bacterium]|nr:signal peptidase II [Lachnospiraceae bacterium]